MTNLRSSASRLSLDCIQEAAKVIDPVFRDTPQFISEPLSQHVGMRVLCKVECLNPIRSFKGRGASYFLHCAGPDAGPLVAASAGNFGQGLAYAMRQRGRSLILFAATTANPLKVERMRALGADVRLVGDDFDAAKAAARAFAERKQFPFVEDGREPAITEGAGTIAVELCRWPDPIAAVLVPVGNGALINGIGCWMKAHAPDCLIIGVCAERAPCMALSWRAGQVKETPDAATIADGIAVRVPVPEAVTEMVRTVDDMVLVSEDHLRTAVRLLHEEVGLVVEPAGAAGLAAVLQFQNRWAGQLVAIPIGGGNVAPEEVRAWLA